MRLTGFLISTRIFRFQSTHPLRGATTASGRSHSRTSDFNPRTPCGVRLKSCCNSRQAMDFNPRTPCGVRHVIHHVRAGNLHFNPRTPCGVRQCRKDHPDGEKGFQSTHPLRGATVIHTKQQVKCQFQSTHPLRGATKFCIIIILINIFQSTHPLRGATSNNNSSSTIRKNFNPRTPCGVRQQNCRNIPGKFAQKLQNFCKAEQRAALPRVGQRESGRYFRPCAVRTSRGKPERFRFASDNERALRSVARLCAEVLDAGFILVSKVIKA